jgi:hypothetical protein
MNKSKTIADKIADTKILLDKYLQSKKEREELIVNTTFEKIINELHSLLKNYIDDPYQTINIDLRIETPLLVNNLHLAELVKSRCQQYFNLATIISQNDGAAFYIIIKNE